MPKKAYVTPAVLDWTAFESRVWTDIHGLHDIAKRLKEISDVVKRFGKTPIPVRVEAPSKD